MKKETLVRYTLNESSKDARRATRLQKLLAKEWDVRKVTKSEVYRFALEELYISVTEKKEEKACACGLSWAHTGKHRPV